MPAIFPANFPQSRSSDLTAEYFLTVTIRSFPCTAYIAFSDRQENLSRAGWHDRAKCLPKPPIIPPIICLHCRRCRRDQQNSTLAICSNEHVRRTSKQAVLASNCTAKQVSERQWR